MNIYDKAHEFAKVLKISPEVVELRNAGKKIETNEINKKMLNDFRKLQYEAYSEQIKNGKLSSETENKLNSLGSIISTNPDVAAYIQAEAKFGVIWEDIMKILNDAIDIDLTFGIGK
ncbi:MAG: YlbF family regulator [Clostridiaceae bacterium]